MTAYGWAQQHCGVACASGEPRGDCAACQGRYDDAAVAARGAEANWCLIGADDSERLHHVDVVGEVAWHLDADGYAIAADMATRTPAIAASCGLLSARIDIPGVGSRLGEVRCPACCAATGYPSGEGSPKNDPACRQRLDQRLSGDLRDPTQRAHPQLLARGPRPLAGQSGLGFVHAFTSRGWLAYAGGVLEVAQRAKTAAGGYDPNPTVVRVHITPEQRRWLATALLAEPPAAPLPPLADT